MHESPSMNPTAALNSVTTVSLSPNAHCPRYRTPLSISLDSTVRPDYKKLSNLKQLFPKVPIIALTATCGKTVLNDVVRILRLPACTPGERAEPGKTVFFSAPLYRKHLHYSIRNKPASAPAVSKEMAEEILKDHANDTGIIYCLSQKDTMTVAQGLAEVSGGKIRTGTYHAGKSYTASAFFV